MWSQRLEPAQKRSGSLIAQFSPKRTLAIHLMTSRHPSPCIPPVRAQGLLPTLPDQDTAGFHTSNFLHWRSQPRAIAWKLDKAPGQQRR